MAHSSWGQGWPNCNRSNIVTIVRRDGLRLPIHRELAPLVTILMDLTEVAGYSPERIAALREDRVVGGTLPDPKLATW